MNVTLFQKQSLDSGHAYLPAPTVYGSLIWFEGDLYGAARPWSWEYYQVEVVAYSLFGGPYNPEHRPVYNRLGQVEGWARLWEESYSGYASFSLGGRPRFFVYDRTDNVGRYLEVPVDVR